MIKLPFIPCETIHISDFPYKPFLATLSLGHFELWVVSFDLEDEAYGFDG